MDVPKVLIEDLAKGLGVIRLRKVLDLVVTYLERASVVECIGSDSVVNLLRG